MSELTIYESSPDREELKSLLPNSVAKWIDYVPAQYEFLDETSLKRELYPELYDTVNLDRRKHSTFDVDQALRFAFWDEYDRAKKASRAMVLKQICAGILSIQGFHGSVVQNPSRLGWIISRPQSYENKVIAQHAEYQSIMDRLAKVDFMERVCRCHHFCQCKPPGWTKSSIGEKKCACKPTCICPPRFNSKVAEAQIKVYAMLDLRAYGSIPQVIKQQNLNVNVNKSQELPPPSQPETMEEVQARLNFLRSQREVSQISSSQASSDPVLEGQLVEVPTGQDGTEIGNG